MRLYILHKTHYRYPSPGSGKFNELRLHPLTNDWQRCESCFVSVLPTAQIRQYLDLNGNLVHHFEIPNDHSKLMIESRSTMVTEKRVDFENLPYGISMKSLREVEGNPECRPYLQKFQFYRYKPRDLASGGRCTGNLRMSFRRHIRLWSTST